ncbi:hypothetical protein V8G54_000833 [Vigna mungo]|uniref:Uncharacterized protein n=1 Tax=Vigna mungo TaxID=3915 RepID=A0AAQ3P6B1_VIGMU
MSICISVNRTIPSGSGWDHKKIAIVKNYGVSYGKLTLESIVSAWTTDKSSKVAKVKLIILDFLGYFSQLNGFMHSHNLDQLLIFIQFLKSLVLVLCKYLSLYTICPLCMKKVH